MSFLYFVLENTFIRNSATNIKASGMYGINDLGFTYKNPFKIYAGITLTENINIVIARNLFALFPFMIKYIIDTRLIIVRPSE